MSCEITLTTEQKVLVCVASGAYAGAPALSLLATWPPLDGSVQTSITAGSCSITAVGSCSFYIVAPSSWTGDATVRVYGDSDLSSATTLIYDDVTVHIINPPTTPTEVSLGVPEPK